MNIIQISLLVIIATFLSVTLRKTNPEFSIIISIVTGILIISSLTSEIFISIESIKDLINMYELEYGFFELVLKIVAISYICEFTSGICKDAGCVANAQKVELAGKIIIVTMTIPIITTLADLLLSVI